MKFFDVDKAKAERILLWAIGYAQERCDKWYANMLRQIDERMDAMRKKWEVDVKRPIQTESTK